MAQDSYLLELKYMAKMYNDNNLTKLSEKEF